MQIHFTACSSVQPVKNGRSRHGHQGYRYKACRATFGDVGRRLVPGPLKQNASQHYVESVDLRSTERLVGVSRNSVMNWVKKPDCRQSAG